LGAPNGFWRLFRKRRYALPRGCKAPKNNEDLSNRFTPARICRLGTSLSNSFGPGEIACLNLTTNELAGLREYILRGGFSLIDGYRCSRRVRNI
jgi:hypothetical protein